MSVQCVLSAAIQCEVSKNKCCVGLFLQLFALSAGLQHSGEVDELFH